jgi:hypothetical protein
MLYFTFGHILVYRHLRSTLEGFALPDALTATKKGPEGPFLIPGQPFSVRLT